MRTSDREVYISVDVETDGPCPGVNSMLQLGAVAFDHDGREIDWREWNLADYPGGFPHPDTLRWWTAAERVDQYNGMKSSGRYPGEVMCEFNEWARLTKKIPVAICYPSGFDFSWVHHYCYRFLGECPFSFSRVIDIKAVAWSVLNTRDFSDTSKRAFPREWSRDAGDHTHRAAEDAREQGRIFFNIIKWKQREEQYQRNKDIRIATSMRSALLSQSSAASSASSSST